MTVVGGLAGARTVPPVTGVLLALQMVVAGTGLKPDGFAPMTGMVAVGVKEKIGAGKAMLNLGRDRSTLAGGERWLGETRGGVSGPYCNEVAGRAMEGGGITFRPPN